MVQQIPLSRRAGRAWELVEPALGQPWESGGLRGLLERAAGTTGGSAHLSLMPDRQVTVGIVGPLAPLMPRGREVDFEETFCANVLRAGDPVVIDDVHADARVCSLRPVTAGLVGAYLGVPVITASGDVVGVLCVFDAAPRRWNEQDVASLEDVATDIAAELERLAAAD